MGMKEEIFSIATALGYDGPTPTSKTKAVHAVAEVAGSGGGGGDTGYDVTITKEWAVPEQTVTSREITGGGEGTEFETTIWGANVTVGDLEQMLEYGQTDLTLTVDGSEYAAQIGVVYLPSGAEMLNIATDDNLYAVNPLDETTYVIGAFSDTEPTAHTVSAYVKDVSVTITDEFGYAVEEAESTYDVKVVFTLAGDGNLSCNMTQDEIDEALNSGKKVSYWLDNGYGPVNGFSNGSDYVFTKINIKYSDTITAYVVLIRWSTAQGEEAGWSYKQYSVPADSKPVTTFGVRIYKSGPSWRASQDAATIYEKHQILSPNSSNVAIDMVVSDGTKDYRVTDLNIRLAGSDSSTAQYTGHFWYLDEDSNALVRGLVDYNYADATLTVELREKVYQLTPAS